MTGEKRMTGKEAAAECAWLLEGGVHPYQAAQQLGYTMYALEMVLRRQQYKKEAREFQRLIKADRAAA